MATVAQQRDLVHFQPLSLLLLPPLLACCTSHVLQSHVFPVSIPRRRASSPAHCPRAPYPPSYQGTILIPILLACHAIHLHILSAEIPVNLISVCLIRAISYTCLSDIVLPTTSFP